jgi:hypothetical protein
MQQAFFPYAIPLSFGPPLTTSGDIEIHAGSCVAVQFEGDQFIITARHVVEEALAAVATGKAACLAGNVPIKLTTDVVSLSAATVDVATIRIPPDQIPALQRDGYFVMQPGEWPPSGLAAGDPVLVAGFPGAWRRQVARDTVDFRGTTKLALVQQTRDSEFVCQLDPAFVDQYTIEQGELSEDSLPGMSGGPAILVRQETVLRPLLCGVLKQGWDLKDGNRILYFARLDSVAKNGTISM